MRKTGLVLAALLLLGGCNRINNASLVPAEKDDSEHEQLERDVIMTCTQDSSTVQFRATGDQITSTINSFSRTLEEAGFIDKMDEEKVLEDINAKLQDKYGDLKGVEASARLNGDEIEYIYTVNYLIANLDELEKAGIIESGEIENQYISMSKTKKLFEDSGYACTVE